MSEYRRGRNRYGRDWERENTNQGDDWVDMAEQRLRRERRAAGNFHRPGWVSDNYDDEMGGVWSDTWGRGYNYSWGGVSDWRQRPGRFTGVGPKGYQRSDERIREDVNDRLTWHGDLDASNITVTVQDGEVTLEGTVEDRRQKRLAEDIIEDISGVKDIHNHLHLEKTWLGEVADRITGKEQEDQPETGQTRAQTR